MHYGLDICNSILKSNVNILNFVMSVISILRYINKIYKTNILLVTSFIKMIWSYSFFLYFRIAFFSNRCYNCTFHLCLQLSLSAITTQEILKLPFAKKNLPNMTQNWYKCSKWTRPGAMEINHKQIAHCPLSQFLSS